MTEPKTLDVRTALECPVKVPDAVVHGKGDLYRTLAKSYSIAEGWTKSTKAMYTGNGCMVQVTTQQKNPDGSYSLAEALVFIPGVKITVDDLGNFYLVEKGENP